MTITRAPQNIADVSEIFPYLNLDAPGSLGEKRALMAAESAGRDLIDWKDVAGQEAPAFDVTPLPIQEAIKRFLCWDMDRHEISTAVDPVAALRNYVLTQAITHANTDKVLWANAEVEEVVTTFHMTSLKLQESALLNVGAFAGIYQNNDNDGSPLLAAFERTPPAKELAKASDANPVFEVAFMDFAQLRKTWVGVTLAQVLEADTPDLRKTRGNLEEGLYWMASASHRLHSGAEFVFRNFWPQRHMAPQRTSPSQVQPPKLAL